MKHLFWITLLSFLCFGCSEKKETRITRDFTEGWQFALSDSIADYSSITTDDSGWRKLDLPHDWSIEGYFSEDNPATPGGGSLPGGIGWYRKTFIPDHSFKEKQIYIDFDGVYCNSEVWINGISLGKRPNGYISFRYDLTPYIKFNEKNVIAVKADNSQQPNSRWYSGSGIYRNVWMVITNPVHVAHWGTYVTTPEVSEETAKIHIETKIENHTDNQDQTITIHHLLLDDSGKEIASASGNIQSTKASDLNNMQEISINHPHFWNIEQPYLYTILTKIEIEGKIVDEYTTTTGIRTFKFDPEKGFFLNGKNIKINGVCNHHDLGCLGAAVNIRAIERQLEILKEMGCNGIRCSHNPPAPELLDLCDKMGFIVMDEAFDMWRKKKSPYDYSQYFTGWYERDLTDLLLRDRNHPSIFIWSIGNEVLEQWTHAGTDTLGLKEANILLNGKKEIDPNEFKTDEMHINALLTIRLAEIAKKIDPTRPITAGCNETSPFNHLFRSGALDIIGFNYHEKDFEKVPQNFPGKPFIVAESVSALMSRGYYEMPSDSIFIRPDSWDKPFSQPIQQCSSYDNCHVPWGTTHENNLKLVKSMDFISGQYVWTGFDYLGEPTPFWWPSRSSYFGIIDLAGFPKDIYYMYQSEWTDKDVLHIFPHWNWVQGDSVDIWSYYNNADEVELFVNEHSMGIKKKNTDEMHVWWRIPFEAGTLKAVSRKQGKIIQEKEIRTAGEANSIRLTADRKQLAVSGKDLSFITVEISDREGNAIPTANQLVRFSIEGDAIICGTDNGDPTEHSSLKRAERKLFNGKCLVVVQAGKTKGKIKLTASSENIQDEVLLLEANSF